MKVNKLFNLSILAGGSFLGLGVASMFFTFTVDGGERALMFDSITGSGVRDRVIGEGIHFRFPLLYEPIKFSVRYNFKEIEAKTSARDLQIVNIRVRILEKPDEDHLKKLYLDQRQNYAEKVLPNITHEIIKAVVARYNPDELITQRENLSHEIKHNLVARAKEFHIIIKDVSVLHIEFSPEYRQAIENKLVSQQVAERAKFIVQKSEQEKKITIINAEAESESANLINKSIKEYGNAFIELKKLETAEAMMNNFSGSKHISFVPSTSNFLYKI
jgi:prohibitin 1